MVSKTYENKYGTKIKRNILKGKCPHCGNNVSSFVSADTPSSRSKKSKVMKSEKKPKGEKKSKKGKAKSPKW